MKPLAIHEHFFAYLYLCRCAALGDRDDIQPDWKGLLPYLRVPTTRADVTHDKPNYRPTSTRNIRDESVYWMADHMAGSFAPSSIRTSLGFVLDGKTFRLPKNHSTLALNALLRGAPISVYPVAAYLLRNASIEFDGNDGPGTLATAFYEHFGFEQLSDGGEAFRTLFGVEGPPAFPGEIFENLSTYLSRSEASA